MGFWNSGSGSVITGKAEDAFIGEFSVIPEGTCADAMIKSFSLVEKENKFSNNVDRFYEIKWKLLNGDFKDREVSQKIKCFEGKPEQIDRALNMMKLIMDLAEFKPSHNDAPQDLDLVPILLKIMSIKIGEWSMPKADGSGMMEGNFVREVHKSGVLAAETGVKAEIVHRPTDSAFQRNAMPELPDDGLPF